MDTYTIIGLVLIIGGGLLFFIAVNRIAHYERKLAELDQRLRKDDQWRNGQKREEIGSQERSLF